MSMIPYAETILHRISMLALDFAVGGVMNLRVEDSASERTQH